MKRLRVFAYHFCYHKTGGHVALGLDKAEVGWDLKRVLGTVEVEDDGSVSGYVGKCSEYIAYRKMLATEKDRASQNKQEKAAQEKKRS